MTAGVDRKLEMSINVMHFECKPKLGYVYLIIYVKFAS